MAAPDSEFALPGSNSPITGQLLDDVAWTNPDSVANIVQQAPLAQPAWAALSINERIKKLDHFATLLLERHDEITAKRRIEAIKSWTPQD